MLAARLPKEKINNIAKVPELYFCTILKEKTPLKTTFFSIHTMGPRSLGDILSFSMPGIMDFLYTGVETAEFLTWRMHRIAKEELVMKQVHITI